MKSRDHSRARWKVMLTMVTSNLKNQLVQKAKGQTLINSASSIRIRTSRQWTLAIQATPCPKSTNQALAVAILAHRVRASRISTRWRSSTTMSSSGLFRVLLYTIPNKHKILWTSLFREIRFKWPPQQANTNNCQAEETEVWSPISSPITLRSKWILRTLPTKSDLHTAPNESQTLTSRLQSSRNSVSQDRLSRWCRRRARKRGPASSTTSCPCRHPCKQTKATSSPPSFTLSTNSLAQTHSLRSFVRWCQMLRNSKRGIQRTCTRRRTVEARSRTRRSKGTMRRSIIR